MAKTKVISAKEAAAMVKDGATVMIGGFLMGGSPDVLCEAVAEAGPKDLNVITCTGDFENQGLGRLIHNKQVKKLTASHAGTNKEIGNQYSAGELDLVLQPQGTLAEQIRAGAFGLGGILTPTGIGTTVADGKQVITVDGKDYLLETPIRAEIALLKGYIADESGNIRYRGAGQNYNPLMAGAADTVIVEVEKLVPAGEIGPDYVQTPHIFVDYIVVTEG